MKGHSHEDKPSKTELGPLEGFKNQNLILKQFGVVGVKVYNAIDKNKTVGQIIKETGVNEKTLMKVIDFMEQNNIVSMSKNKPNQVTEPILDMTDAPVGFEVPDNINTVTEKEVRLPAPKKPESSIIKPIIEPINDNCDTLVNNPKTNVKQINDKTNQDSQIKKQADKIKQQANRIKERAKLIEKQEILKQQKIEQIKDNIKVIETEPMINEIKPINIETKPKNIEETKPKNIEETKPKNIEETKPKNIETKPQKPKSPLDIPKPPNTKIQPIEIKSNSTKPKSPIEIPKTPTTKSKTSPLPPLIQNGGKNQGKDKPKTNPMPKPKQPITEQPKQEQQKTNIKPTTKKEKKPALNVPKGLSPIEKIIYKKFPKVGIEVYNLIDGEKTAEEILKKTGISEIKLVEILEFLDNQGIIKLEKPDIKKQGVIEKMAPINDTVPEGDKGVPLPPEDEENYVEKGIIPIDIPVKTKSDILTMIKTIPLLMMKFKGDGKKVYDLINGKHNIIELAIKNNMTLDDIDSIFEFLGKNKLAVFKSMDRMDIKKKYGNEGFSLFKKYGRDGILVYELIGQTPSFKKIVERSGINAEKVVDIFVFVHKVLNIELPLTKQMMYRQLGL